MVGEVVGGRHHSHSILDFLLGQKIQYVTHVCKDLLRKIMVVSMETVQKTYCG